MGTRIFLGLSALVWLPYGLYCFFAPASLVEAAGVVGQTATGTTEVRAMYGGLQSALGILLGSAVLRASLVRPALLAVAFATGGLGVARLFGLLLDGGLSSYTGMALAFEFTSAGIAIALLRRE